MIIKHLIEFPNLGIEAIVIDFLIFLYILQFLRSYNLVVSECDLKHFPQTINSNHIFFI